MEQVKFSITERLFHFKRPAGTSRGEYTTRKSWLIKAESIDNPTRVGWGECAPLPQLSCDDILHYAETLQRLCSEVECTGEIDYAVWCNYPSMVFGIEMALRHLSTGSYALWNTPFSRGEQGICINGLIWMGDYEWMFEQIKQKIEAGFRCVKLKIGAIDFEQELSLLQFIRKQFSCCDIELRVDANGAFNADNAYERLCRLSALDLHSIEQPIRAGQCELMAKLIEQSPLPIAFDEELIGVNSYTEKCALLDATHPAYIVLKPSLHGGWAGCEEWIKVAESRNIGWWITSALESNIGLNAIAQWVATKQCSLPQGLGTGMLFIDNIPMPLEVRKDCLWYGMER